MRLLLTALLLVFTLSATCQQRRDTISLKFIDFPLELILDSISFKSGYQFSFNSDLVPVGSLYSLNKKNISVSELLAYLFTGIDLRYTILDDQIILRKKANEQGLKPKPSIVSEEISIIGWIREYESKLPIPNVNVFINGTTIGTTTDQYGNYQLRGVKQGRYDLVFSHLSYELASYGLEAERGQAYAVNGLLDFKIETLNFIEIVSEPLVSDNEWPKFYKLFTKEFFGTSPNGTRCEIINPEALEFSYEEEEDILKAEATQPLIIFNNALGYKLTYNLESFQKQYGKTSYYGKARFENLTPSNSRIRKKWRRARLRSYRGSVFHFMRSITRNTLDEQGFKIFRIDDINDIYTSKMSRVGSSDILRVSNKPYNWELDFNGYLVILYERELESSQYLRELDESKLSGDGISSANSFTRTNPDVQKSIIELNRTYVTIDRNGQIVEPLALSTIGYWAWERLSELVPANYDPKSDNL
jgi:hypothetical protein